MSETRKVHGLYLNQPGAQCSIYESGLMVYRALQGSALYDLSYFELTPETASKIPKADFYLLNYHHATMAWLNTASVRGLPGKVLTVVLEMLPGNPFVYVSPEHFDGYVVLDPTLRIDHKRTYAFPRPLEGGRANVPYVEKEIPWIGTFGFSTPGKGFEQVVEAVNREFDRALVRINIPVGTFADGHAERYHRRPYGEYLAELCQRVAKPGIDVQVTRDFLSKEQLIEWCAQNTLNCFLYCRNQPGLSATTDQCITAGRPLAVSSNETFRHLHQYIRPYPERSLRESIALSIPEVARMREDWTPKRFTERFEAVLRDANVLDADAPIRIWSPPAPRKSSTVSWENQSRETLPDFLRGDALENALRRSHRWNIAGTPPTQLSEAPVRVSRIAASARSTASAAIIPLFCNEFPLPDPTRVGIFLFAADQGRIERALRAISESGRHTLPANTEVVVSVVSDQPTTTLVNNPAVQGLAQLCDPWSFSVHQVAAEPQTLLSLMGTCSILVSVDPNTENDVLFSYALGTQRPVATLGELGLMPTGFNCALIRLEECGIDEILARGIAPLIGLYNEWSEARAVLRFETAYGSHNENNAGVNMMGAATQAAVQADHSSGGSYFNRVLSVGSTGGCATSVAEKPAQSPNEPPHVAALSRLVQNLSATQQSINDLSSTEIQTPKSVSSPGEELRLVEDYLLERAVALHEATPFRRALLVHTADTQLRRRFEALGIAVEELNAARSYSLDHYFQLPTTIHGHYDLVVAIGEKPAEYGSKLEAFFGQLGSLLAIGGTMLMCCRLESARQAGVEQAPLLTAHNLLDHYLHVTGSCRLLDEPEWANSIGDALVSFAIEKTSSSRSCAPLRSIAQPQVSQ